jgi:hypothetical protein
LQACGDAEVDGEERHVELVRAGTACLGDDAPVLVEFLVKVLRVFPGDMAALQDLLTCQLLLLVSTLCQGAFCCSLICRITAR